LWFLLQCDQFLYYPDLTKYTSNSRYLLLSSCDKFKASVPRRLDFWWNPVSGLSILWMKVKIRVYQIKFPAKRAWQNFPFSSLGSKTLQLLNWCHTFILSLFFWGAGFGRFFATCPGPLDFSCHNVPKRGKYRPNYYKLYQMATKYTKLP
jgi:hypothetical protein